MDVVVLLAGDPALLRGEALLALQELSAAGIQVQPFDPALLSGRHVVVDALLGIGVRGPLRAEWIAVIQAMNACGAPILSLDLPSGLEPDTGRALPAVRAGLTISFLALKQGLLLAQGPEHTGTLVFDDLGVASAATVAPAMLRIDLACLAAALPPRPRDSHKGMFGRVLFIGGGAGMPGAVRLAAESALRAGAGLVTVASLPEHLVPITATRPELMFHAVAEAADIDDVLHVFDVVAIGPGLGRSAWAQALIDRVFTRHRAGQRLVVDADALNLLAAGHGPQHCPDWILTPHPGEAARLLGTDTHALQSDRMAALEALCQRRGGTIVLKGSGTLVGRLGSTPRLCPLGNPGMAVPGMGDVLTGAVAGLVAQSADPMAGTVAAVYAHAMAGDRCAKGGVRGILAGDVAQELRAVLAQLP